MTPYEQDPNDVLDYPFDWSTHLGVDTITTSQFIADAGVTVESDAILDNQNTIVWLSGVTEGKRYGVTNRVETLGGRTKDWTIFILGKVQ